MIKENTSMKKLTAMALTMIILTFSFVAPSFASPVGGPQILSNRIVGAYSSRTFTVTLRGGEATSIGVSGDGDTDLDLYVYDALGNLIAADDDSTDECRARIIVYRTGSFTIKVVNHGALPNEFDVWAY
jgi:hypothetical protein